MMAGGALSYLLLIPLIKFSATGLPSFVTAQIDFRDVAKTTIRSAYILYIGAGAVAAGPASSVWRGRCRPSSTHQIGSEGFRKAAVAHTSVLRHRTRSFR